jgi:hypothetical protein
MSRDFQSIDSFLEFLAFLPSRVGEEEKEGLEAAGKLLEAESRSLIGQEGVTAGGHTWAALAESTVTEKRALGYVGQVSATDPLLRRGELRSSIHHTVEENEVILGSDDPIAPYQEYGTARIPPRSFIEAAVFLQGHAAADRVASHIIAAVGGAPRPQESSVDNAE